MSIYSISRRAFVVLGIASLPFSAAANNNADDDGSNAKRFKTTRKDVYTLDEMFRLSLDEKQKLFNRSRDPRVMVIGFSNLMTAWLLRMSMHDTPRLKKLIRDMARIKDSEKRWDRLQAERDAIQKEIRELNEKAEAILKKHGDNRVHNMRVTVLGARMAELDEFSDGLEVWQARVKEGNLPPPKVKP